MVGHFICPYCPRLFKVRESLVNGHVPREHPSRVTEMNDPNLVIQFLPIGFSQPDHSRIPASSIYDPGLDIEPTPEEAVEPVRKQPGKVKAVSPEPAEPSRRRGPKRLRLASSSSSSSSAESVSPRRSASSESEPEPAQETGQYIPLDSTVASALGVAPVYNPTPQEKLSGQRCEHGVLLPTHRAVVHLTEYLDGRKCWTSTMEVNCSRCPVPVVTFKN